MIGAAAFWLSCSLLALLAPIGALAIWLRLHHHLLAYLRLNHHMLWVDLGAPTLFDAVRLLNPGATYTDRPNYGTWLRDKSYRSMQDSEILALVDQLQRFSWAAPLILIAIWGALVWSVFR